MNQLLKTQVCELLNEVKKAHYIEPLKISDAQAFGILMAKFFEWDGSQILKATYEGLEDSNFHTENLTIDKMIKELGV